MIKITGKILKKHSNFKQSGFTLMELVIVIILIAILGVSLTNITQYSIVGYIDAKDRNQSSQSAKWVTERISREIREALPQSVRTGSNSDIHCVEFMSIVNSSTGLNMPASGLVTSFNAVGYDLAFSSGLLLVVMPIDTTSTYSFSGTLANIASITQAGGQATITLTAATTFDRRSPSNRFYLLESPISFCMNDLNGEMTRYDSYGFNLSQSFPPVGGNSVLLGENFSANGNVFNYQAGTLSRASLLQMNLRLQNRDRNLVGNSESFEVFHEVHIRNVP